VPEGAPGALRLPLIPISPVPAGNEN